MKKLHSLMMAYAAMGMMIPDMYGDSETVRRELTPQELAEIERVREQKTLERKKKQGLKEWNIQGIKVIALNHKNAVRKAGNIRKLLG
jgi:hypothetical protein